MEFEIRPQTRFSLGLREMFDYRELFYFFTWRDIKVKYKQTALGLLWAVLQPFLMAAVFTFFLGKAISGFTAVPMPYHTYALSGLLIWNIFSSGLNNAGNSMVSNANIIRKIYFPRLIVPVSAVLVALFDFIMAFIVFLVYELSTGTTFLPAAILFIPFAVLLVFITTLGAGAWLAALNVKYRDFRYVMPFLIQLLLFISPVIYPATISSNKIVVMFLKLNPLSAPLELFRGAIGQNINWNLVGISTCADLLLLAIGIIYFRRTESYFADLA